MVFELMDDLTAGPFRKKERPPFLERRIEIDTVWTFVRPDDGPEKGKPAGAARWWLNQEELPGAAPAEKAVVGVVYRIAAVETGAWKGDI